MECNDCTHKEVCTYKREYKDTFEVTKNIATSVLFKIELKCSHYSKESYKEGV